MFEITGLNKTYINNNKKKKHALKDISFSTPEKGMFFIVGENGAGKSTLIKHLTFEDEVYSGEIKYKNKNMRTFTNSEKSYYLQREIALVSQDLHMFFDLNVKECIELSYRIIGKDFEENILIEELIRVNLKEHLKSKISDLSVGERQRLIILLSLIKNPSVIFMDEPTSALDEENSLEILNVLKKISKSILIIIVSHDTKIVNTYADQILIIENGKIKHDELKVSNINDNFSINIQPNRLKNSDILKLSFKTFTKRGGKLYIYLLLSIIFSFGYLFLEYSTSFSIEKASKEYFKNTGNNYVTILNREDNLNYPRVFPVYSSNLTFETTDSKVNNYYENRIGSFVVIDESIRTELNKNLMVGLLPSKRNEILITDYHYHVFNDLGINSNPAKAYNTYHDILNEEINLNGEKYYIKGVLNTGINNDLYKNIAEQPFKKQSVLYYELTELQSTSILNTVFFSEFDHNNTDDISFWLSFVKNSEEKKNIIHYVTSSEHLSFGGSINAHYEYNMYNFAILYKYKTQLKIILIAFVVVILSFFSTEIIILRKKDMRLLKNYGVDKKDIWKIYIYEGQIFSLFIYSVVIVLFVILTFIIETTLKLSFNYSIVGYNLNFYKYILLGIIYFFSSSLSITMYYFINRN